MPLWVYLVALALPAQLYAAGDMGLEASLKRLTQAFSVIQDRLAEPFDPEPAFYQGAIPAMVRTLDPHSAFLDPQQFESLQEMQTSTEKGFGSVVSLSPGRVIVLQTLPGSPSAKSGLGPGDEISVINGYPLANLDVDQLVSLLSQSRRQKVELMVKRPNFARLIPMTLTPEALQDPSVPRAFALGPGVGYVKVASFEGGTDRELRQAIEKLGGRKLRGLVLDLRNNPGGMIESAVRLAAMFLEPRERILWIQGRDGPEEEVRTPEGTEPYRFPLAVLIDDRTASAAELVVGALQDHDRAKVIGLRSFGKGLVQSVFPLSEGTGLALTTAVYLSPSGRPIQRPFSECNAYQFAGCGENQGAPVYRTDAGREVPGGGGIEPDIVAHPRGYAPFEAFLKANNLFLDFAKDFVRERRGIQEDFEVTAAILDDFQFYLSQRGVRPPLSEWTATVEFIRNNLQQEILNLTAGVAKGDEVELRNDAQVLAAKRSLGL